MTTDGGARGMNIRDHILAGHYPTDDKGRALVPTAHGLDTIAVICATDKPGRYPILGWLPTPARVQSIEFAWDENGCAAGDSNTERLLPPPPRKVKVSATLRGGGQHEGDEVLRSMRREDNDDVPPAGVRIELTGEYEEPWS